MTKILLPSAPIQICSNAYCRIAPLLFAIAIVHYVQLGRTTRSNNAMRGSADRNKNCQILNILAVAEIGGFSVLLAGFLVDSDGLITKPQTFATKQTNLQSGCIATTKVVWR